MTANERVYLILKTTVRLSHPDPMDLVLRKRLSLNIYKRQSFTERIRKRIVRSDYLTHTGVTYELVSNIPKVTPHMIIQCKIQCCALCFTPNIQEYNCNVNLFSCQASEELEERESLAQIAASGEDASFSDGETYIGKLFLKNVTFVLKN